MSVFCWSIQISPYCKQIYWPWIESSEKKVKYHDVWLEQTKNLIISQFSFLIFCHTNFWAIASAIFDYVRKWNFLKILKINPSGWQVCWYWINWLKKMVQLKSSSCRANLHGVLNFCWRPCIRGVIANDPKNLENIFKEFKDF